LDGPRERLSVNRNSIDVRKTNNICAVRRYMVYGIIWYNSKAVYWFAIIICVDTDTAAVLFLLIYFFLSHQLFFKDRLLVARSFSLNIILLSFIASYSHNVILETSLLYVFVSEKICHRYSRNTYKYKSILRALFCG